MEQEGLGDTRNLLGLAHKLFLPFLISDFRRDLNIVYFLLGISPASNCSCTLYTQPLKMELIQGSETSANYNLTPGKYPEENIQYFRPNVLRFFK